MRGDAFFCLFDLKKIARNGKYHALLKLMINFVWPMVYYWWVWSVGLYGNGLGSCPHG